MYLAGVARPVVRLDDDSMSDLEDITPLPTDKLGQLSIFQLFEKLLASNISDNTRDQLAVQLISMVLDSSNLRSHEMRCKALSDQLGFLASRYKTALTGRRIFIGFNLFNSGAIMNDLLYQLLRLMAAVGANNVFISIYENGSEDDTKIFLSKLDMLLAVFGVPRRVLADFSPKRRPSQNRIEYLAAARNRVLEPLLDVYDKILFINDVYFCDLDMLELLAQSFRNDADITCGFDYVDGAFWKQPKKIAFYDSWVFRDIQGRPVDYNRMPFSMRDQDSQTRYDQGKPFRVMCCWNGAAVLNPLPFVSGKCRFRRGLKLPQLKECAASECSLLCKDFMRLGFDHIIAVPLVGVTYNSNQHELLTAHRSGLKPYVSESSACACVFLINSFFQIC
jgi:alpha-1,3-mannosyltransferase